jgi:transcriptional regulator with XRE-family HTH domain
MKTYAVDVGRRIKALRITKGLSQRELANRLHVDPRCITNWETGRHAPEMAIRAKLAGVLGAAVAEIFLQRGELLDVVRGRALTKSLQLLDKPNASAAEVNAATNSFVRTKETPEEKSASAREEEDREDMRAAREELVRKLVRFRQNSEMH